MGFEFSEGKLSKDDKKWFKKQLRSIERDIELEPDCADVGQQLTRDLYYGSQGLDIDLSDVTQVRLDTLDGRQILTPIENTPLGYLCEEVLEEPTDEPEFVLVCGAIFGANNMHKVKKVTSQTGEFWPLDGQPTTHEMFFEIDDPHIIVNRRLATAARVAIRSTFTKAEYKEFAKYKPKFFTPENFMPATIEIAEMKYDRLIPRMLSLSNPVIGMTAALKNGSARFFT